MPSSSPIPLSLAVPESYIYLLRRGIISCLYIVIYMHPCQVRCLPLIDTEINYEVWTSQGRIGWPIRPTLVKLHLKDPIIFPYQRQYLLRPEVNRRLLHEIDNLGTQDIYIL